jgi:hypothetical protein
VRWFPTGLSEPPAPPDEESRSRVEWPMGLIGAFGPSMEHPFGDYPSWFVRVPPSWWADWREISW